jgi:hypothetical protein
MLARQIVVGFGIAAIIPWLIYYGLSTIYPPPKIQDFYGIVEPLPATATPEERKALVAEQRKKREEFDSAARGFARTLFSVSTVLGVAAILTGAWVAPHSIGTGLILGGVFSLALGNWGYAQHLDDWLRFLSLLAGLVALVFVGFRRIAR